MEDFKISVSGSQTIIELPGQGFRMQGCKSVDYVLKGETALLEATLYVETSSYIPFCSFLFELVDSDGVALSEVLNLALFRSAIDFFFVTILNTDLYVKSVPIGSILCSNEVKQLHSR